MVRVEKILENPQFRETMFELAQWESDRIFCKHDLQHGFDVARILYILLLENQAELELSPSTHPKEISYALGLLHDIGKLVQYKFKRCHAQEGAERAYAILLDAGFTRQEANCLCEAISQHREYREENSELGKMLYQADKLSRNCSICSVQNKCHKVEEMLTVQNKAIY